jgi:hypothetical protein
MPSNPLFKKPKRVIRRVFLHCSASDRPEHDDISVIRSWHIGSPRFWDDVGYHYFIKRDGTIQKGRNLEKTPAAQAGHNTGTIAICLHGLEKDRFSQAQFDSLRFLCALINNLYKGGVTFHGHCEVSSKSCPVFDYKNVLMLDAKGKMNG